MNNNVESIYFSLKKSIPKNIEILVVSKNQNVLSIEKLYQIGHRNFGENYIQEMIKKYKILPKDIRWHMIGKIQSNKLKYLTPFVHLIHSVQKIEHLRIINKLACKQGKIINCLLQIKICNEKSKSGITSKEANKILESESYKCMKNVNIIGLMGMASFVDLSKVHDEFYYLQKLYNIYKKKYGHYVLSMGMSRDYSIAIKYGSTLIRIGTSIFGKRSNR
ncbi:YggS family pyridoxal phosphate-dependent enzyme [Blattabacterium cuenoti]|uniref:YggS family pyridoxal phosphate-dependent enzyme n=1 Tax=Blattabacterium cuenoti TaxID=1653831 RepID=UPI00163CFCCC|nr:YggS family pyridoxal phosphate-dependent enzyme [Blattabacterium cuenoti]